MASSDDLNSHSSANQKLVKEDDKSRQEVANVAHQQTGGGHSTVDIPSETTKLDFGRPGTLHRVPPELRENKEHLYTPVVIPLGPYHHDDHRFGRGKLLKNEVLNIKLQDENDHDFARGEFLKRAQEIRSFYGVLGGYNDETLAEMMLRDACFIVYYMESFDDSKIYHHIERRLGLCGSTFLWRDFAMLENQVPLWAIKLLIRITLFKGDHDDTRVEEFILKFVSEMVSHHEFSDLFAAGGVRPWGNGNKQEPLHLLELHRIASLIKPRMSNGSTNGFFPKIFEKLKSKTTRSRILIYPARSVMDLKAKGIHVCPSSKCLTDIRFESYRSSGKLLLPICYINNHTKVFFSNLIAFEMSPETETEGEVISYVNFMQSLIESPKDVKELRQQGVLSSFMNDEQVMNTFKEIDTYGMDTHIFDDLKDKIGWHCGNKAKTFGADLGAIYFRNPWTLISVSNAVTILYLTCIQTIFSILNNNK